MVVRPVDSIRDVMVTIDRNAKSVALVVDAECRLIDVITDGDIRRAILARVDLDSPIQALVDRKRRQSGQAPVTAPVGTAHAELLAMMSGSTLRHIPLVDQAGRVVDLARLDDLVKDYDLPLTAVVMAGGHGTRLRPLTADVPKPMLPVGDEPLLAIIVKQLRDAGIRRLTLATHYKADVIERHFGDGRALGVEIDYVQEERPLGTAGALRLLDAPDQPLLVVNGDLLTTIDFRAMLNFHREHDAEMTVAVCPYEVQLPYGVVETEGVQVTAITEKPILRHFVSAGVYLLNPAVCREIPAGSASDMPDLITRLVEQGRRVISFPVRERWLDIGQVGDYETAQATVRRES